MSKSKEWFELNIAELKARSLNAYNILGAKAIVLVDNVQPPEIDLIQHSMESGCKIMRRNIISFNMLCNASTLEERIKLVLDAVRNYDFMFYIDQRLIDLILKE